LLCHGMVCVVGRMRDLILQLSKSSIYSTKPYKCNNMSIYLMRFNPFYEFGPHHSTCKFS
nr:hypothetical protein [Escherichia coli]